MLAVDVTQALGRVPLDLAGADVVVSSTHKWILASHGGGLVGVRTRDEMWRVPAGGSRLLAIASNFDIAVYPRTHDPGIRASKVAEYFGVGAPLVGYDHRVVADVREAGAGILVSSPREFVAAVERLLTRHDERSRLAAAAKAAGIERDWRTLAVRYAELLDRYLPPLH